MSTTLIEVRRAKASDASAIASTHDEAWRAAYQGIIPGPELDKLINRRGANWPRREFDAMFEKIDEWPQRKGPGAGYLAALQMRRLIENSLDGGLASQSKYVWRR